VSVSSEIRQTVRVRARLSCEYCGVSEGDTGGELTVDHYQPLAAEGGDDLENLVYACFRCNLHKGDYWHETAENARRIFNPRLESINEHFWLSANGTIYSLTETAAFTIRRLQLNRAPLRMYRRKILQQAAERGIIEQMQETINLLSQTNEQQRHLLAEQRKMLDEQQKLLKILLDSE
jgi:hypothetical protein